MEAPYARMMLAFLLHTFGTIAERPGKCYLVARVHCTVSYVQHVSTFRVLTVHIIG